MIDGNVTVAAAATLTIQPGVVVKFNGATRTMTVSGRLIAEGTEEMPILFTSAQDDSLEAGGDTNGDGSATAPAPGQWLMIRIRADGSSFRYADVRYGGNGSGAYQGYGAVSITGGSTTFHRVSIHDNAYSGIRVTQSDPATADAIVTESSIVENGNGISAIQAHTSVSESQIAHNAGDGLYFAILSSYSGKPAPSVINNKIASNGRYGVFLGVETGVSAGSFPYGHENNILNNNTSNPANKPKQLYSLYGNRPDADWSNNYWGVPAEGPVEEVECQWVPAGKNPWHLTYGEDGIVVGATADVPPGPINFSSHYMIDGNNEAWWCGSDAVQGHPFSPVPFKTPIFDFEPMTPSEERNAATGYYRPYLFFDEAEHWQPVDVDEFLAEVEPNSGVPFHRGCPDESGNDCIPIDSVGDLTGIHHIDVGQVSGDPPDGWPSPRTFAGGPCVGSLYLDCTSEPYATIYYNRTVVDGADGDDGLRSYWDYWWFYRYNDFTTSPFGFDHEGDWEGMTVVTFAEQDEDPDPTGVLWVSYAEHGAIFRYTPAVLNWTGLHPHGFPADGSHATYPYPCATGPLSNCPNDANPPWPDGDHGGELAWQQNTSCVFCVDAFPETGEAWVDPTIWPLEGLNGWNSLLVRWGASGSPSSPGQQSRYLQPWVTTTGPAFEGSGFSGESSTLQTTAQDAVGAAASTPTIDEADCASWFGPGVVAVACDESVMQRALDNNTFGRVKGSLRIETVAAEKVGTTSGLAQAFGRHPLQDGQRIQLIGAVPPRAELRIRVSAEPENLALAQFSLRGIREGIVTVRVSGSADRPSVQLVLPDGRRRNAESVATIRRP